MRNSKINPTLVQSHSGCRILVCYLAGFFSLAIFCAAASLPPNPEDRELAVARINRGNFFAVRGAIGRLAEAGDYLFLNELLRQPRNENHEFVLLDLIEKFESEESALLSVLLYNYLVTFLVEIRNSNGEDASAQAMVSERIITRLLPQTGVSIEDLDFYQFGAVRQYLEKIRPAMERLRKTEPGLPALDKGWSDAVTVKRSPFAAKSGVDAQTLNTFKSSESAAPQPAALPSSPISHAWWIFSALTVLALAVVFIAAKNRKA